MGGTYRLPDEPRPSPLSRIAVDPVWPLLAVMFGGVWLSWGWFALNAFALGSSTRWREVGFVLGGLLGSVVVLFLLGLLAQAAGADHPSLAYAAIALTVWKIGVTYGLHHVQAQGFELYEWYGGKVAGGLWLGVVVFLVARRVSALLGDTALAPVLL